MATAQTDATSQSAIASELGKAIAYRKAKRMTSLAFACVPCKHRTASHGRANSDWHLGRCDPREKVRPPSIAGRHYEFAPWGDEGALVEN
jgi:hypothetical protein